MNNQAANLNFNFKDTVSENVINSYLKRAITYYIFSDSQPWGESCDKTETEECLRAIYNVGAKLIARASGWWIYGLDCERTLPSQKEWIEKAHTVDPDLVFEACIFETCSKKMDEITIPTHVQEVFGLEVDPERKFNCDKMLFPDGYGIKKWGEALHCPDITQLDTQLFYYYAATRFIDAGFEALHLGQVMVTGKNDENFKCWVSVVDKIRDYAKTHARRGYVFINGHAPTHMWMDGEKSIGDYATYPLRIRPASDEVDHMPTEENPQRCEIAMNYLYSVYGTNGGAIAPSGWKTENFPYLVELDNWSTSKTQLGTVAGCGVWGTDEISWYANQPDWYRHKFLNDTVEFVESRNENGHFAIPGKRTSFSYELQKQITYYMNSADHHPKGWSDENVIKALYENVK